MAYNVGYTDVSGYNTGYTGAYTAGPSISAADDAVEAQTETVTISDYTVDPTELRLGGNVVAFTFNAGVLTYTAPLLPNNDTLAVEVDVDGFTLSTTIAYSNTYPYTHTPAVIDDNSILPDSSFGTAELVELKVITDANASVLTIDWDGYDADNFASAVADFITPVSETAASTDVTMGYLITETGVSGTFTRTLSVTDADLDAPTLSSPTATAASDTTATGTVTTDEANGTLFYLVSESAVVSQSNVISLGESQAVSATGVQNVSVSALTASTDYYMHYVHRDAAGNNSTVSVSAQFTTEAAPVVAPTGSVTFGTPTITDTTISQPTSYAGSDATGFERRIDGGAWVSYTSPIDLASLTAETAYLIEARATNSAGAGPTASVTRTTSAAPVVAPTGTVSLGTPTITETSITQPTSYAGSDATGFEYSTDNGNTWTTYTSPVELTGLTGGTSINFQFRATNSAGAGPITYATRTTSAATGPDYELVRGQSLVLVTDLAVLAPGDFYLAYAVISGNRHYLDVVSYSSGNITVSVPADFPLVATEGTATLYVDRARSSA